MLTKLIIWMFVFAAVFVACWIGYSSYSAARMLEKFESHGPYGVPNEGDVASTDTYLHDTSVELGTGRWAVPVYPRSWATVLIMTGSIAIITGLIFVLHVPFEHSS